MTRSLLLSAIAVATGETRRTVKRFGFRQESRCDSAENDPVTVIDCPCCGGTVVLAWNHTDDLPEFADCRRCETAFPYSETEIYEIDLLNVAVREPRSYLPAA